MPKRRMAGVARRVAAFLAARGMFGLAAAVLRLTGRLVGRGGLRAGLLGEAAELELSRGREPRGLVAAYAAELEVADDCYRAGKVKQTAGSLTKVLNLAFHRIPQFDRLTSPLALDPGGFTAPLRRSAAARAVTAPRGRTSQAAPPAGGRPLRLLIVTHTNANFLPLIRAHYEDHPDVELRFLDLATDESLAPLAQGPQRMLEAVLGGQAHYRRMVEAALRPHLDWADIVFVEWCTISATLLTLVDPGDTRIVLRLHSFEAFTHWPHRVDFSRVDDVVFVSDHVRELTTEVVPRLSATGGPTLHVVGNAMDLAPFQRPKEAGARHTLGLIGIAQIAKDPRWGFEVLRLLRAHDDRYRLLLVGGGLDPSLSSAVRDYHDRLERDLAELEPSGAVRRLGQLDDIPAALAEVGVILSTSVREGAPCGLVEGAASGAVPVVRDWPFFAGRRCGARTLFPAEWVVGSPQEAAARILAVTADEETWCKTGQAAAEHALATWDWTVIQHDFDRLLLPGGAVGPREVQEVQG
jgi:glycosyltransferase involved in cell wall biosynthesis